MLMKMMMTVEPIVTVGLGVRRGRLWELSEEADFLLQLISLPHRQKVKVLNGHSKNAEELLFRKVSLAGKGGGDRCYTYRSRVCVLLRASEYQIYSLLIPLPKWLHFWGVRTFLPGPHNFKGLFAGENLEVRAGLGPGVRGVVVMCVFYLQLRPVHARGKFAPPSSSHQQRFIRVDLWNQSSDK